MIHPKAIAAITRTTLLGTAVLAGAGFLPSQEKFKAGYSAELFEDLTFSLNTRYEYGSSDFAVRADLTYLLNDKTSAHLAAGDELDFLWNSNSYSLVETPMDDSTGLFFYVEHLF